MSKKTLVLSPGVKKGKIPHIPQTQNYFFFKKIIFAFFCELSHSEQENQKKKFGKIFSLLTFNIPETQKKNQNFEKKKFNFNCDDFDFDKVQFSLYTLLFPSSLVCLIVMDLEYVGTKIFDFFFNFNFDDFAFDKFPFSITFYYFNTNVGDHS